jgi:hypothetical protein
VRAIGARPQPEKARRVCSSTYALRSSIESLLTVIARRGHYGRALEDALSSQRSQWPREWNNVNPISGGKNFNNMTPTQRVSLI